jgi:tetratricopeptide (TPR) repeat protein
LTHRYGELKRWLDAYPDRLLPKSIGVAGMDVYAIGDRPVDEFRGWTELLLGDKAEAANRGRDVLQFLSHAHETKYNRWFLRALTAQAYTFMGEKDRAIGNARESLTIAAQSPDLFVRTAAAAIAAQVYAWSGAPEQSVDLLERLASTTPGLSPAAIARDPLYATPLAQNVRYRALVSRLEDEMRQTRLP